MRSVASVIGVLLFLSGLGLGVSIWRGESSATTLDSTETVNAVVEGPPPCSWEVDEPERIMSEDKSQAIVAQITNIKKESCESSLSLRSSSFDKNPPKDEQKITLESQGKGSVSWILTPNKTGTFDIAVSDIINTKVYGITVTNVFGLTSIQAKLFSIGSTLFGPMLTVPWWWDRSRRRKLQQEAQRNNEKEV